MSKQYPQWKYHPIHKPMIVHNEEADQALGDEWVDSQSDLKKIEVAPAVATKPVLAEVPKTVLRKKRGVA